MTIIDFVSGTESTWIEWTEPHIASTDISRVDPIRVKFSKLLDTDCLNADVIKLYNGNGDQIVGAFNPISFTNDWDPISMILELSLSEILLPDTDYILIIDGLYDAVGDSQEIAHTVPFRTNISDDAFILEVSDSSVINVVDRTISNADLVVVEAVTAHSFYMNPTDGSYNVAADTGQIYITVTPALINPEVIIGSARRRPISSQEVPWEVLAVTTTEVDESHVDIELPLSGSNYVDPGYEYEITVAIGNETKSMYFLGELPYMFTTVQSVLIQAPSLRAYEVAKYIYIASAFATTIDPSLGSAGAGASVSTAAQDFSLYETLSMLSRSGGVKSYQLADLSINYSADIVSRWKKLADSALARIVRVGPRFGVKGSANARPYAARDWDAATGGTTKTRAGSV